MVELIIGVSVIIFYITVSHINGLNVKNLEDKIKDLGNKVYNLESWKFDIEYKQRITYLKEKYNVDVSIGSYELGMYGRVIHHMMDPKYCICFDNELNTSKLKYKEAQEFIMSSEIEKDIKIYLYEKANDGGEE